MYWCLVLLRREIRRQSLSRIRPLTTGLADICFQILQLASAQPTFLMKCRSTMSDEEEVSNVVSEKCHSIESQDGGKTWTGEVCKGVARYYDTSSAPMARWGPQPRLGTCGCAALS